MLFLFVSTVAVCNAFGSAMFPAETDLMTISTLTQDDIDGAFAALASSGLTTSDCPDNFKACCDLALEFCNGNEECPRDLISKIDPDGIMVPWEGYTCGY